MNISTGAGNTIIENLNIELEDSQDIYKVEVNKGIDSIKLDGKEVIDSEIYGDGENYIEINGGI